MSEQKVFEASAESKGQAKQLRLFAFLAWLIAIAGEIFAIIKLKHGQLNLTWLIVSIVVILILSVVGSTLWKKANRLDPASEKDGAKFFIQNQLGAIMSVLAFLPLIIIIFTDKKLDGKTKGIAGAVGIIALLIAGITGADFNPPSIEKYSAQLNAQDSVLTQLTGKTNSTVYWAPNSEKYHLYPDCQYIKGHAGVAQGSLEDAFKARKIGDNELCSACEKRAEKEHNASLTNLPASSTADSTK
ncbi:hypothetical protein A9P82_12260 [Arachidicoccus ginsenosidimutans]|uniref:hypothetical protein n=1 Tax=Arachidicoccus sp. BS20 TaxID=1850526 RepID=UPI0007F110F7|nr:hypothetical protein [Arachidicoccus sp. BS20]ANI89990.1 hypothetical protein A9P82_12260 [Arachidicoccus sp. BS20]